MMQRPKQQQLTALNKVNNSDKKSMYHILPEVLKRTNASVVFSTETCCCCCSSAQLCTTLCYSMDCRTSDFIVLHHLLELAQTPCPLSQSCHPAISSSAAHFTSCPQFPPVSGSFPMSQLFTSGGQSIGASASASVLPMNSQD